MARRLPDPSGKDPNFAAKLETGEWYCHSQCGRGGDILDLEQELSGADFRAAHAEVLRIVGRPAENGGTRRNGATSADLTQTFDYVNEAGRLLFQAVRTDLKDGQKRFSQRRPDGHGGWIANLQDVRRVLYRLPEVLKAEQIYVAEGEKCVHALEGLGVTATCNPMGAGKWRSEYADLLAGKDCVVLPDNDEPGQAHALEIRDSLASKARSVRLVELPGLPAKGDVVQWIAAGGTRDQLIELAQRVDAPKPATRETISNASGLQVVPKGEPGPDPGLRFFPYTDSGNAERLVKKYAGEIRYCWPHKCWYIHTGKRWEPDQSGEMLQRAKWIARELYEEASRIEDTSLRKDCIAWARKCESADRRKAAAFCAQSEPGIPIMPAEFDSDPFLLNCLNGTVELRTGDLREHQREDLITRLAPVVHNTDTSHQLWARFLADSTGGDIELLEFLQRAAGYSLTGSVSEEVLFFVHGAAASGKSTFLEALKSTFGDYAKVADFETFIARREAGSIRNDIAELAGRRFVVSIEVDEGKKLAEGLVKMLTGGDTVRARFLYQEAFDFAPTFKLWLAANHAPRVRDNDTAIWRRILRVPFEKVVPKEKRDPTVKARLRDPDVSGPAILAWAVEGCLRWQEEGLKVPQVVEKATEAYRADMDPLKDFLEERCELGTGGWVLSSALRSSYEDWAKHAGERRVLDGKAFAERLIAMGCERTRDRRTGRGWSGITLREA